MKEDNIRQCFKSDLGYQLIYFRDVCPNDLHSLPPHHDTEITVTYLKQCSGSIKIEGNHYNLSQGNIVLLNPDELHCFLLDDNLSHERITVSVSPTILNNFSSEADFKTLYNRKSGLNNLIPADLVKKYHLDEIFNTLLSSKSKKDLISEILNVCKIIELLSKITEILVSTPCTKPSVLADKSVNEILNYLNSNFLNHITVDSVAEHFFVSKYHLCRFFKEKVGVTLWNYVTMRRLLYFNELIKQNYSLETACYKSGFNNYSNFFRLYKKYMDITPLEFKRQLKAK